MLLRLVKTRQFLTDCNFAIYVRRSLTEHNQLKYYEFGSCLLLEHSLICNKCIKFEH